MNLRPVNDKNTQIKRYPNEIIKFFQKSYPDKTDFANKLFDFHKQLFDTNNAKISITLVNIDSHVELLGLLYLKNACFPEKQVHARILSENLSEWTNTIQSESNTNSSLAEAIKTLNKISPIDILGWQRFKFDDGKSIIDIFPHTDQHLTADYPLKARKQVQAIQFGIRFHADNISHSVANYISQTSESLASIFMSNEHPLNKSFINERIFSSSIQNQSTRIDEKPTYQHLCLIPSSSDDSHQPIAIIGGGLASVQLALSLSERGKAVNIFCKDKEVAQGASGNKQGALYPLLTPENSELSQFFQQAYLFSRQRVKQLAKDGFAIDHDFCGVLHTGHDERSTERLDKILNGQDWPTEIIHKVDAKQADNIAGLEIKKSGAYYPLAGWVCPFQFTQASLAKAQRLSDVNIEYNCTIHRLEHNGNGWLLHSDGKVFGPFIQVVNATGSQLAEFDQTKELPASNFRGQVSHVPSRTAISKLKTVICAHGYMTPANNNMHCVGASYVRLSHDRSYQPIEQLDNLQKMQHSYPDKDWVKDIDITGHDARVGVRMVTRDHFPMLGCAPDYDKLVEMQKPILNKRKSYVEKYWKDTEAPIIEGLYVLGALGSRGLCSGPLAAEIMASLLCNEIPPVDYNLLKKLNPNRMWVRKVLKNKPI